MNPFNKLNLFGLTLLNPSTYIFQLDCLFASLVIFPPLVFSTSLPPAEDTARSGRNTIQCQQDARTLLADQGVVPFDSAMTVPETMQLCRNRHVMGKIVKKFGPEFIVPFCADLVIVATNLSSLFVWLTN